MEGRVGCDSIATAWRCCLGFRMEGAEMAQIEFDMQQLPLGVEALVERAKSS